MIRKDYGAIASEPFVQRPTNECENRTDVERFEGLGARVQTERANKNQVQFRARCPNEDQKDGGKVKRRPREITLARDNCMSSATVGDDVRSAMEGRNTTQEKQGKNMAAP